MRERTDLLDKLDKIVDEDENLFSGEITEEESVNVPYVDPEEEEEDIDDFFDRMIEAKRLEVLEIMGKQKTYDGRHPESKPDDIDRPVLPSDRTVLIPIEQLYTFPNHPFPVNDNAALQDLIDSINESGIREPLIVINRFRGSAGEDNDGSGYYIISGHRRKLAAEKLGIKEVPCMIKDWDMDEATQAMVETNIHRPDSEITPMAKARAYDMYMIAHKRKPGKKSVQNNTEDELKEDSSFNSQTRETLALITGDTGRYIDMVRKLLDLNPFFQDAVDRKKIAMNAAYELSFLKTEEQNQVQSIYEPNPDCKISINAAKQLRKDFDSDQKPTDQEILDIMTVEHKAQKSLKITFDAAELERFFPGLNAKEIKEQLITMLTK